MKPYLIGIKHPLAVKHSPLLPHWACAARHHHFVSCEQRLGEGGVSVLVDALPLLLGVREENGELNVLLVGAVFHKTGCACFFIVIIIIMTIIYIFIYYY